MSNFDKVEKEYIQSIISECKSDDLKKWQFNSIFYTILQRSVLLCPKVSQGFELKKNESDAIEKKEEYKKAILEGYIPLEKLVNLFRYLESNHLITFIPNYNGEFIDHDLEDFKVIFPGVDEDDKHERIKKAEERKKRFTIKDTHAINFLHEKYSYIVSPSKELIYLVNNKFKSREEMRHTQILFWTRAAFVVAFISSIITTCGALKNSIDVNDAEVLQELKSIHKGIEQSEIPEIINPIIINGSINLE